MNALHYLATTAVFAGAFAGSVATIAAMVAPQWRRIARLACGHVEVAPVAITMVTK